MKSRFFEVVDSIARRKLNQPPEFSAYQWSRVGQTNDLLIVGGIPREIKKGPNKGKLTWRDSPIRMTCVVTDAEIKAEMAK